MNEDLTGFWRDGEKPVEPAKHKYHPSNKMSDDDIVCLEKVLNQYPEQIWWHPEPWEGQKIESIKNGKAFFAGGGSVTLKNAFLCDFHYCKEVSLL